MTKKAYVPTGFRSSVPIMMWFMFLTNPVAATIVTRTTIKPTKAHITRKWSERPI